ncbi:MAG: DUF465 domain-containing protein [Pseudomonadota bacterium]
MTHTPHELAEEFPDSVEKIHALKSGDAHFSRLADEYHSLNREIHRLETRVEVATSEHEEALRRERVHLKDEIAAILTRG